MTNMHICTAVCGCVYTIVYELNLAQDKGILLCLWIAHRSFQPNFRTALFINRYHQSHHTCKYSTMTFHEACQEKEETSGVISGLSKTMGLNFTGLATSFFLQWLCVQCRWYLHLTVSIFLQSCLTGSIFARPRKSQSTVCMDLLW